MNLEPIFLAVQKAAILCREVQKNYLIGNAKGDASPVTIADYGSQAIICEAISRFFPEDRVMAEESGQQFLALVDESQRRQIIQLISTVLGRDVDEDDVVRWLDFNTAKDAADANAGRTWVIDPIDGTKGFLALRHYVIAVGILEQGQVIGGVMGCPAYPGYEQGALFYAHDGATYIRDLEGGEFSRVYASTNIDPMQVRVLESVEKSHASQDRMAKVREYAGLLESPFERVDSQEKYARIAAGDAELYLRLPRLNSANTHHTWDHAGGAALVLAAGGQVTDIDGSPLDFSQGASMARNQGMIVTNGKIHARVLEAVKRVLAEETERG